MKKYIADIISSSRIALAVALFFFSDVNLAYLVIYIICAVTDFIDGPIARKLNTVSEHGALLDTVGDVLTYVSFAKIMIVKHMVPAWIIIWFALAAVGIVLSGVIAKARFDKFYIVHSLFGKIMGFCAFLLPVGAYFDKTLVACCAVCIAATISALESCIIQMSLKEFNPDIFSLHQLKSNKKASSD
jgi:CDP-diacylglycerol--glycerol-3-phosphate 3-phosphatidyltransferase